MPFQAKYPANPVGFHEAKIKSNHEELGGEGWVGRWREELYGVEEGEGG